MQGALTQEYLESFEEAQHSRPRSGPQNCVANFQDITLADTIASEIVRERLRGGRERRGTASRGSLRSAG